MKKRTALGTKAAKAAESLARLIRAIDAGEYGSAHWNNVLAAETANLQFHIAQFCTSHAWNNDSKGKLIAGHHEHDTDDGGRCRSCGEYA